MADTPETVYVDRRYNTRFDEKNEVFIEFEKGQNPKEKATVFAFTNNLSLGGVKILSNVIFPVGKMIRFTIALSRSEQKVIFEGKVIWAKRQYDGQLYEMGIEFIHDFPETFTCMFDHIYGRGLFSAEKKEEKVEQTESIPSDEDRQSPL